MKRLLLVLIVVAACVLGLAFYRGWIGITTDNATGAYSITFMVDKEKLLEDEKKAAEKLKAIGQPAKE